MRNSQPKTEKYSRKGALIVLPTLAASGILFLPILILAAGTSYTPLESSVTGGQSVTSFGGYLQRVYQIGIMVTIALAVLYLVIGGFGYMTSGTKITDKEAAKSRITNAIFGLLLALLSYVILNTLSPQFTQFSLNISEVGKEFDVKIITGSETGCFDCVYLSGMPVKGGACDKGVCQLNSALAERLEAYNKENPGLILTEGYPKTASHVNICHDNGSCADVNYMSKSVVLKNLPPTPEQIAKDILAAEKHGLRFVYEVKTQEEADRLRKDSGLPDNLQNRIISANVTAPHFSVYLGK